MAEVRFNYGDKFTQTSNSNTGIGSTIPASKLDVKGGTRAGSLSVTGIASLSSYRGVVEKLSATGNISINAGESASITEIKVSTGSTVTVSTGATSGQSSINSLKVGKTFMPPVGGIADRPVDVIAGSVYYNKDLKTIEFWDGNFWKQVDNTTRRGRCVWAGGYNKSGSPSSNTSRIDFVNSHTLGNSRSFGDLSAAGQDAHGSGNAERGLFGGRFNSDAIEYITIASEGDSIDFGNSTQARYYTACASSSTRSLTIGGYPSSSSVNTIDYVQIMTLGNALDFGDLSSSRLTDGSAFSNGIEAFVCGGYPAANETYEVIKISSTGSSIAGDKTKSGNQWPGAGCSNSTRGIWAGGANSGSVYTQEISYISMASKGNAQHFGDLSRAVQGGAGGGSNATRGIIAWGRDGFSPYPDLNTLEFITFSSSGKAQDFGDLRGETPRAHTRHISPVSDSHGGLGGF